MKWQAPSERTQFILLSPVIVPVGLCAAVVILPMVAICYPISKLLRHFFPPPDRMWPEYSPWYAWHPVRAESETFGEHRWVWLEQVDRAGFYNRTLYRTPTKATDHG